MKNCKKWQMTDRDGRKERKSGNKEERKSEASAREILKKCGQHATVVYLCLHHGLFN